MLVRLNKTSEYSAERQLYALLFELLEQKTIVANDFITRAIEIMTGTNFRHEIQIEKILLIILSFYFNFPDLSNPNSQMAKALRVLPALTFKI